MSFYDILLAKKLGGGGGSSVSVEPLSVTSNGTYSETGKAYSPVSVNVPNSYTASDEGKVVSSGALVAQTSQTIDTNGTYDTTLKNSVTVNVSGGGGSNVVKGTLTATADGAVDISLPYTGNGYPILVAVYPKGGGDGNTSFANLIEQGAVRNYIRVKANMGQAPASAGATKIYDAMVVMKSNSTSASRYAYASYDSYWLFEASSAVSTSRLMYFRDTTHMSIYMGGTAASGHFALNIEYEYAIVYSE